MVGERGLDRYERFQIVIAGVATARPGARPFRIAAWRFAIRTRARCVGVGGRHVVELGCRPLRGRGAVGLAATLGPIGHGSLPLRRRRALGRPPLAVAFALPGALKQRIALELSLDIGGKVEIGELQQLDGLHQLRRHHQRMALANLESLGQRHIGLGWSVGARALAAGVISRWKSINWSNSCLSGSWSGVYPFYGRTPETAPARQNNGENGRSGAVLENPLYAEFLAEIEAADLGVVDDVVLAPLHQDLSGIDDVGAVGEVERLAHVMVGDEHADAARGE